MIVDGYDVAGGGIIARAGRRRAATSCAPRRGCATSTGCAAASTPASARRALRPPRRRWSCSSGERGTGKHRYARALEQALFDAGPPRLHARRHATCSWASTRDLTSTTTQAELVRRFGEVAHLLLDAGLIVVSTTNAIGLADHGAVQALIPDFASIVIDVDPGGDQRGPLRPAHPRQRARSRGDREDRRPARPPRHHHPRLTSPN